jgi:hypothetical protein
MNRKTDDPLDAQSPTGIVGKINARRFGKPEMRAAMERDYRNERVANCEREVLDAVEKWAIHGGYSSAILRAWDELRKERGDKPR